MHIEFFPATGATVTLIDKDGEEIPLPEGVAGVRVQPMFLSASGVADVFKGTSVSVSRGVVDNFAVVVSGGNGKVGRRDVPTGKAKPVVPSIDKMARTAPAAQTASAAK